MPKETKILFDNIKNFRLLTEGIGEKDMADYINNHEYIYIYYGGDANTKKGYRTIRPYVLGNSKAGNLVVRAYQDIGKSKSYSEKKRGEEHDFWNGDTGTAPGWRMFRLDKIEKIYPTGKKFNKDDGSVMIPPKYKEGSDADMTNIIAYVSSKQSPEFVSVSDKETVNKVDAWDRFKDANKNRRNIERGDVIKLRDIASNVMKKGRNSFLVVINNRNEFELVPVKNKDRVPEKAIVGNLSNLYDTMVVGNEKINDRFFDNTKNKVMGQLPKDEIEEDNSPSIPNKFKTFFRK